ncbi:transposable element Tcb1 transposase [Trichonephila clavipes]|nr:transposable element Tcb1 transposase [Trichonephila clavipes]
MDQRGCLHPPRCTTARVDRRIVHMAVMDTAATSRTIAQQIYFVTNNSVSSRTIRRRLQQSGMSARRPLLRFFLTGNHRCLRRQWCDERWACTTEWNDIIFTDESHFCLQHHNGWILIWKHRGERLLNCCVEHRHIGIAPGILFYDGFGFHFRTLLIHIVCTLNSQRYVSEGLKPVRSSHVFSACHQPYSKRIMRDHTWHAIFKSSSLPIRFSCFLGRLVLSIYRQSKTCGPASTTTGRNTPSATTIDQLWQYVEVA